MSSAMKNLLCLLIVQFSFGTPCLLQATNAWLGPQPPGLAYPPGEDDRQYAILEHDLAQRAKVNQHPDETFRSVHGNYAPPQHPYRHGNRLPAGPRLVQPVLDRNCVRCHDENKEKAPRLDAGLAIRKGSAYMDATTTYFASYLSLAPKFAFTDYGDPLRAIPGKFGGIPENRHPKTARLRHSRIPDSLSVTHAAQPG